HAVLHFIDRCGHAPMIEHPAVFNRHLLDFLAATFGPPLPPRPPRAAPPLHGHRSSGGARRPPWPLSPDPPDPPAAPRAGAPPPSTGTRSTSCRLPSARPPPPAPTAPPAPSTATACRLAHVAPAVPCRCTPLSTRRHTGRRRARFFAFPAPFPGWHSTCKAKT